MHLQSNIVGIEECIRYDRQVIKERFERLFQSVSFRVSRGSKILLKPNLISAGNNGLACTHPEVVAALAEWFLDHGTHPIVGDSPAFGTAKKVMLQCGISKALQGLPVGLTNFTRPRKVSLSCGVQVGMASEIFECDALVNIPKLKAHGQLLFSGAVKNCFGAVVGMRKPLLHAKYGDIGNKFETVLVDLLDKIPDGVSVLDGILAMHKSGPLKGEPCSMGVLACSLNPVALDTAIVAILGKRAEQAPLWHECRRRGVPGSARKHLLYPLLDPSALADKNFILPERLKPVSFHPGRLLTGGVKRFFAHVR